MVETRKAFQVIAHIIMIMLALFCILPIILMITSSFTSEDALILNGYSFFPSEIDFTAYKYLLVDSTDIIRGYMVSAVVTVIGTTFNVTVTTLFAYPLSRKNLPGRRFFMFFIFFTMLFNGGLIPTYIMWTGTFHIKNTLLALILPNLLMNAFYVFMMRTYFTTNIPNAVIEATKIDGAAEFHILGKIVLPMSRPIIATVTLMAGLSYWNDWLNGLYYINTDKLYSIQVLLNKMLLTSLFLKSGLGKQILGSVGETIPTSAIKMAVAVLGALPILIVYPFFQKYFVKGIVVGAVKG